LGTGYAGRTVIYEILEITDQVKQAILKNLPDTEIEALARNSGMLSLIEAGDAMVISGETSREEIIRVVGLNVT
jgi:type II secretory ATPase GspE/PulE/Tfp pilus assembly ATPase PilB-like protein